MDDVESEGICFTDDGVHERNGLDTSFVRFGALALNLGFLVSDIKTFSSKLGRECL
jgi:hypothetical protein